VYVGGYRYYGGWASRPAYYAWYPATWAALTGWFGGGYSNAQPVDYAYGTGGNVYYEGDTVYVNGEEYGDADAYTQEAVALAQSAPPAEEVNQADPAEEEWLPLGVFAVAAEDSDATHAVIQLAVNKQGVIAGTYANDTTGATRPLQGTVDLETQRVAITFADGRDTDRVLETGLSNLTQDEAPALFHFGPEQTQSVLLVRLDPPEGS